MFVGVYERQLDERGRVALPSAFRSDLGDRCYLFLGEDGCVSVRSEDSFQAEAAELIDQRWESRGNAIIWRAISTPKLRLAMIAAASSTSCCTWHPSSGRAEQTYSLLCV